MSALKDVLAWIFMLLLLGGLAGAIAWLTGETLDAFREWRGLD